MQEVIIDKLSEEEIEKRGIRDWPIWEKEVSRFDWHYDSNEQCLILEGEVTVYASGETYLIQAGDFVIFPKGLACIWDISEPIKKHYNFT
jgi:uncharacterized protein